MEMEDPPFIGDWYQQRKLGAGGFGVVTLWKNQKTSQCVGKQIVLNLLLEIINVLFLNIPQLVFL